MKLLINNQKNKQILYYLKGEVYKFQILRNINFK